MRDLSAAILSALADGTVRPAVFFHGVFADGDLRLWSGSGDIVAGGFTWTGAGNLLAFAPVEETGDVVASGSSVTLSGVPAPLVATAIDQVQQGLPGRVLLGLFNAAGALIGNPFVIFDGRIDVPDSVDDADTCTLTISLENRLIDLQRVREWRYTDESQKTLFPGDRGFEFVTSIQDIELTWGRQ